MFDKQTKKFAAAVVDALPETPQDIMQGWISNPKGLQKVLCDALLPPPPVMFLIWKIIQTGVCENINQYLRALEQGGVQLSHLVRHITGQKTFRMATAVEHVCLVKVTPRDLGFNELPKFNDFLHRAKSLGLRLCPAEVGPALCLQYHNQPAGEYIGVAMESVKPAGGGGGPDIFVVSCDKTGVRSLELDDCRDYNEINSYITSWVFVYPK